MTPEEQAAADQQKRDADAAAAKAATDKAAADKAAADKAAADAAAKLPPDKYELKFADDSLLDPKVDFDQIAAFAKAQGWTNEQAQKHLEHVNAIASGVAARQQQAFTDIIKSWEAETWADKDLGGDNRVKTEANIKRVMDKFAPEGSPFHTMLKENGLGNHPDVVRFLNAIGKAMAEDKPLGFLLGRGSGKEPPQPVHRRMYPNEPS